MAAPFVDVDVDGYWRPPYPVKSWKVRPESLLVQAGAAVSMLPGNKQRSPVVDLFVRCVLGISCASQTQPRAHATGSYERIYDTNFTWRCTLLACAAECGQSTAWCTRTRAFPGLASKLAEELCWQIHDNPVFRFHLVREGAVVGLFAPCCVCTGGNISFQAWWRSLSAPFEITPRFLRFLYAFCFY
jgi:hypothetical protein